MRGTNSDVTGTRILEMNDLETNPNTNVVESALHISRTPPEFVLDLSNTPTAHHLFNVSPHKMGGIFYNTWTDSEIFGWMPIIIFDRKANAVICQDINGTNSRIDTYIASNLSVPERMPLISRSQDKFVIDFSGCADEIVELRESCLVFATPTEPLNFGMWLLEAIPAAYEYVMSGQAGLFGIYHKLGWQRDLLRFVGIDDRRLFQVDDWTVYRASQLSFYSFPSIDLYVGARNRAIFQNIANLADLRSQVYRSKKIFVSRRALSRSGSFGRQLINESELIDALSLIGFTTIDPHMMSIEDQIAIFHNADVVVGLDGAGMFNVVFSRPGTIVISIAGSGAFMNNHANLFSSVGVRYGVIFGQNNRKAGEPKSPHNPWSVDVAKVLAAIVDFCN
jgi:Glycosyltransferase 61